MEVLADTLYIVALCDAPSSLPADAKRAAEACYARELERALGDSVGKCGLRMGTSRSVRSRGWGTV